MKRIVILILTIIIIWFITHTLVTIIDGLNDELEKVDLCVVLGNKIELDGRPSARLKARLDKAIDLYNEKYFNLILVSGGVGKEGFDESLVMKKYLLSNNIPANKILVDGKGINSYKTAQYTKKIMIKLNLKSVMVISQYYHIPRLKLIFSRLGIDNTYSAHSDFFEMRDLISVPREFLAYYYYLIRKVSN